LVTLGESTPATLNDPLLTERLRNVAASALGRDRVLEARSVMGSEDVGQFAQGGKIPAMMYWLGAADPQKLKESEKSGIPLPGLHSALFAPQYEPAIQGGVTALSAMALDLLK
jgi:hippurate hydrolase